ncbi:MAG: hypothetical protein HYZ01_13940 [Ignavibacteriales bacterium]|nr:hypothetical protein [Ignavibacteriales bacterium]
MTLPALRIVPVFAVDFILLIFCLLHIPNIQDRPTAPFEVVQEGDAVVINRLLHPTLTPQFAAGDRLLSWNGLEVSFPEQIEYLADISAIGASIEIVTRRDSGDIRDEITLVPYYTSPRFLIVSIFTGLTIFAFGLFILVNRPDDPAGKALHWSLITFGVTIMMTWGPVSLDSPEFAAARILWFFAYVGVAASFFFFTLTFPRHSTHWIVRYPFLVVVFVLGFGGVLVALHLRALDVRSRETMSLFQQFFDLFHLLLLLLIGGGLYNIARSLLRATTGEERGKIYWILWGLTIGASPFLFLHILPQLILSRYLIPEEYTTIFFTAVPFAFAVSFLKYRLFDVEVLISRSIVYPVISLFLGGSFLLVVLLFTSIVGGEIVFGEYLLVAGITLLAASVLNPVRKKLQHVVEETLFAARTNFQTAVSRIGVELRSSLSRDQLFHTLIDLLYGMIPCESIAALETGEATFLVRSIRGVEQHGDLSLLPTVEKALLAQKFLAREGSVTNNPSPPNPAVADWFRLHGWSICIPFISDSGRILGAVVVKQRSPHEPYEEHEIHLLQTAAELTSEILDRLLAQEALIITREEHKRLEELSALKSYFISSVSHELRMPLTSIRMFAETLRSSKHLTPRRKKEYLEIIEGESERLSRLIGNVLDFAKIERGLKEYNFRMIDLSDCVRAAARAMAYQVAQHRGTLKVRIPRSFPPLHADPDALEEALLNLLSNALKYSGKRKEILLTVTRARNGVMLTVSDKGLGIPDHELPSIFEKFYRVRDERTRQVGGTGLGLALVKHIIEAHRGSISVKSIVGKGTTFTITLPLKGSRRRHP